MNWSILDTIKDAISADPRPAMEGTQYAGEWKRSGNAWQWRRGVVRITRKGKTLKIWGNHSAGNFGNLHGGDNLDLFVYLGRCWNTDTPDTFRELARRYSITWETSAEWKEQRQRVEVARIAAPIMEEEAKDPANADTEGAKLIHARGWDAFEAVGLITEKGERRIIEEAKRKTGRTEEEIIKDLEALKIDTGTGRTHPVTITNYTDGHAGGFAARSIVPGDPQKYTYSRGLERGPFCGDLKDHARAVVTEGQADALRLKALGIDNVIAIGNATPGANLFNLLEAHSIRDVVYFPDVEIKGGARRMDIIEGVIKALGKARTREGDPLNLRLFIADLGDQAAQTGKADADSWGKDATPEEAAQLVNNAPRVFSWQLERLEREIAERARSGEQFTPIERQRIQDRAIEIFNAVPPGPDRQAIKNYITASLVENGEEVGPIAFYSSLNITPAVLEDLEEYQRNKRANADARNIRDRLNKAVENGTDPAELATIAGALQELTARSSGTRAEWEEQTGRTWGEELEELAKLRDPITLDCWKLGKIYGGGTEDRKAGQWEQRGFVEFWPADITTICAPTGHGKTMFLFQSLMYLTERDRKAGEFRKYIYVSAEENHAQLLERAINARARGENLAEVGGRKDLIRKRLRDREEVLRAYCMDDYGQLVDVGGAVAREIDEAAEDYGKNIFPRVDLIHTGGSSEAIAATIRHYIDRYERDGVEVGAVFIDYFQLLASEEGSSARNYELKTICKGLKEAAAVTGVPFVIAAQLNREALRDGVDNVTTANIAEGADIERISHDIYLIWQPTPARADRYRTKSGELNRAEARSRARRLLKDCGNGFIEAKSGVLYIERLKARAGVPNLWALVPFNGASGQIGETDTSATEI